MSRAASVSHSCRPARRASRHASRDAVGAGSRRSIRRARSSGVVAEPPRRLRRRVLTRLADRSVRFTRATHSCFSIAASQGEVAHECRTLADYNPVVVHRRADRASCRIPDAEWRETAGDRSPRRLRLSARAHARGVSHRDRARRGLHRARPRLHERRPTDRASRAGSDEHDECRQAAPVREPQADGRDRQRHVYRMVLGRLHAGRDQAASGGAVARGAQHDASTAHSRSRRSRKSSISQNGRARASAGPLVSIRRPSTRPGTGRSVCRSRRSSCRCSRRRDGATRRTR